MDNDALEKLLNQYKETEKNIEKYIDCLSDKDYAKGKLDLVKTVIMDLEQLSKDISK